MRKLEAALGPLAPTKVPAETPPGLASLAAEQGLSEADVSALSNLRVRGRQPLTKERWSFIYQALLASESIDTEVQNYQRPPRGAKSRRT